MTKQKKISRWPLGFVAVLIAGLALWYFRSSPVAHQATPLAQTRPATPVATAPTVSAAEAIPENRSVEQKKISATPAVNSAPVASVALTPVSSAAQPSAEPEQIVKKEAALASIAPTPVEQPAEIAASARMYAAHASLREREVADPDSKTNQQILQTMVSKALAQPAPTATR